MAKSGQPVLDVPVDGNALAQAANYSRSCFHRLFQKQIGKSPIRCRRRRLLERTRYQLVHSDLPVTQIAFEAGFGSLEGFSRAFQREAHLSPRQYRKSSLVGRYLPAPNDIHYDPIIGATLRMPLVGMLGRMDAAFNEYCQLVKKVRDENLWDTSFMDILCDPPEAFTYSGMITHVATFSAYRRTIAIEAVSRAGIDTLGYGDPMDWRR